MTFRDYFTTTEVDKNYGELGIQESFMREFTVDNYYLSTALKDIANKHLSYTIGRLGTNIVSLLTLHFAFNTNIGDTMPAIPIIVFGMSEMHRFWQYQEDIANRKQFSRFMQAKVKDDLRTIELQRVEFKLRLGLDPPF